jgi:hypothetical protein
MEYLADRHCFSCGKTFKKPSDFKRHQNRKTPCVIREVDLAAKHRCKFCNRVYKYARNLSTHYKKCKIKNGGQHILLDKLQREHEMKIAMMGKRLERGERRERRRDKQMQKMVAKIEQLEANQNNTVNNGNAANNAVINGIQGNNNNQVQITMNSYKSPNMDDIKLVLEDMMQTNILKALIQSIYFNPDKPENHSILAQNIKEKRVAVYDKTWKLLTSDKERGKLIDDVKSICNNKGGKLLNSPDGPYNGDITNEEIPPVHVNRIVSFNSGNPEEADMPDDEILETFHANRQLVKGTKLAVERLG